MRRGIALGTALAVVAGFGMVAVAGKMAFAPPALAARPVAKAPVGPRIVTMRRLTESQYRNAISDIFGPDIQPVGRFEPIVRTAHQLIATGANSASISPTGLEQFDTMARGIAAQVFDERHRAAFVACTPHSAEAADPACAAEVLGRIGRLVLRRPLTAAERADYVAIAGQGARASGSFYTGLELAQSGMLVSPGFLYITETAEPDPTHPGQWRLDNYTRAARLSFLLWNTTPDARLLDAAAAGRLTDPEVLSATARGMVASPRLADGVRAFFADMLLFEKFDDLAKDPIVYPRFNADVAKALPEQMERTIVDQLVTRHGDYRELFTTPDTFMTRALGPLYGARVRQRDGWEPYRFAPGDDRAGLLGQAGFLAMYSHSGRSSPTLRGKAVRELLLCEPVPNPPPNVNFTVVQDTTNPLLRTARSRLTAHATDPSCSGCHKIMDPLGLTLEDFDGIGAFRANENGQLLDLTGNIGKVSFTGATGLGQTIAKDPALTECVASRMLEYMLGRPVDGEESALETLNTSFEASHYRFPELMLAAATLPAAWQVTFPPDAAPARQAAFIPARSTPAHSQGARL
jgi:hypothetical protein